MIYGLNFGTVTLQASPVKFRRRIRMSGKWWYLAGIADSNEERATMVIVANNGRRNLWVAKPRRGHFALYETSLA